MRYANCNSTYLVKASTVSSMCLAASPSVLQGSRLNSTHSRMRRLPGSLVPGWCRGLVHGLGTRLRWAEPYHVRSEVKSWTWLLSMSRFCREINDRTSLSFLLRKQCRKHSDRRLSMSARLVIHPPPHQRDFNEDTHHLVDFFMRVQCDRLLFTKECSDLVYCTIE